MLLASQVQVGTASPVKGLTTDDLALETWTETPILPKPPFSYRRLSTSLWVFDTYNVPYIIV